VRELIDVLREILPDDLEFVYQARQLVIRYRGVGAIHPHIGQKKMRLGMSHQGWRAWVPGIPVETHTDLRAGEFTSRILAGVAKTKRNIDARLDRRSQRRSQ